MEFLRKLKLNEIQKLIKTPNSTNIRLQSLSESFSVDVSNVNKLSKWKYCDTSIQNIFYYSQKEFLVDIKSTTMLISESIWRWISNMKSDQFDLHQKLFGKFRKWFPHIDLQQSFQIKCLAFASSFLHSFIFTMSFKHPDEISFHINSNMRGIRNDKRTYDDALIFAEKIIGTLNAKTNARYKVVTQNNTIMACYDQIQLESHCVPSNLLKSLRDLYAMEKNIPLNQLCITNDMCKKYACILAANAIPVESETGFLT